MSAPVLPPKDDKSLSDEELIARVGTALDDSTEQIDYAAQLQLKRARANALAQAAAPRASWWSQGRFVLPTGALTAALVLTLFLHGRPETRVIPDSNSVYEDMELLSSTDDLDTLSDMEFYQWLDERKDS